MIWYRTITINCFYIQDKLKRLLIKALVEAVEGFKIFAKIVKLAFGWTNQLWLFLYRYFLRLPLLSGYSLARKTKKILAYLPVTKNLFKNKMGQYFSPLLLMLIIGGVILSSNLQAEELRPEHYGQKSILFKILPTKNEFDDETLPEDDEELSTGPLNLENLNSSYVADVLSADQAPGTATNNQGMGSLISTTQDSSVLISPEITDPSAVVKGRDKIIDYIVQPGDAISIIASKFSVTINTILWENGLTINSTIKGGQILKILPVTGLTHKVAKGENLKNIAGKYKADVNKILEFNKMESADEIQIGQALIIPDGVKAAPATPVYTVKNIITPRNAAQISASKLQWPTNSYRLTQYFGFRHTGLDISNKIGQPIYAAETGIVEAAGWNKGGYGYYVIINHGNGLKTLYAHMTKIYVKAGESVNRGAVIGGIGSTGRSTGPHLHFEVRVNGARVNPLGYVR